MLHNMQKFGQRMLMCFSVSMFTCCQKTWISHWHRTPCPWLSLSLICSISACLSFFYFFFNLLHEHISDPQVVIVSTSDNRKTLPYILNFMISWFHSSISNLMVTIKTLFIFLWWRFCLNQAPLSHEGQIKCKPRDYVWCREHFV